MATLRAWVIDGLCGPLPAVGFDRYCKEAIPDLSTGVGCRECIRLGHEILIRSAGRPGPFSQLV